MSLFPSNHLQVAIEDARLLIKGVEKDALISLLQSYAINAGLPNHPTNKDGFRLALETIASALNEDTQNGEPG